ncbi:MAG: TolC family protein [Holosporaceae bacterium]|jgi:TolC family type I secretion outer membrane protein|nr:TolC family protein [Holosporaceae bacterium]
MIKKICLVASLVVYALASGEYAVAEDNVQKTASSNSSPIAPENEKEDNVDTFEEAIARAWRKNPDLKAALADKRRVEEALRQAKRRYGPDISGTVSGTRSRQDDNSFRQGLESISNTRSTGTSFGLEINQNLFHGFSTMNGVRAAESEAKAALYNLRATEQQLILSVLRAYVNVWSGEQRVVALKKKEENLKKTIISEENKLEAGTGTPAGVAQAEASYQEAVYKRIAAETELFSARAEFERWTGSVASKDVRLPEVEFDLPRSKDELLKMAERDNPEILNAKLTARAAENRFEAARGIALYPRVETRASVSKRVDKSDRGGLIADERRDKSHGVNFSVDLTMTIPFVTCGSGSTQSNCEMENQRAQNAKYQEQSKYRQIRESCEKSWKQYEMAKVQIIAAQAAIKSAQLASNANFQESTYGTKSITEILQGENTLLDATVGYISALVQEIVAMYTMCSLMGQLTIQLILQQALPQQNRPLRARE